MSKTIKRREEIVRILLENKEVGVAELSQRFKVSEVSIRKDLNELSRKGLLVRSRGGAVAVNKITKELSIQEKHTENLAIKRKLGKFVASLIQDGESIVIDSGSTTEEVAKCLGNHSDITVMTNGLNIAYELSLFENITVMMTGGTLRQKSQSFFGRHAEESLSLLRFNKLILGVDGFNPESGISTFFEPEAQLNRKMCEACSEIIVVTDSSKFDKGGFHQIVKLKDIDHLVTDHGIPTELERYLIENGVKLHIIN